MNSPYEQVSTSFSWKESAKDIARTLKFFLFKVKEDSLSQEANVKYRAWEKLFLIVQNK